MKNITTSIVISLLALAGIGAGITVAQNNAKQAGAPTGTQKTLIVAQGTVEMNLNFNRLNGKGQGTVAFQAVPNSFFPIVVFNDKLRGAEEGSIQLKPNHSIALPGKLDAAKDRLVLEKMPYQNRFDLAVRDGKTGFVFFNVEGHSYSYDAATQSLRLDGGRLLVSQEFAQSLGHPQETDAVVGGISVSAKLRAIEVRKVVNGVNESVALPPADAPTALSNGPDIIVGDLPSMQEGGSSGTQVGLSVGT
ncbi:MAG: hypothetical protein ACRD5Z_25595, partial [Bryobacteraceae bacterium]